MNRKIDYESIYLNSPDMGAFIEPVTGNILSCNRTLLDQLGYTLEECLKMRVMDLYSLHCRGKVEENLRSFSENGRVIHSELSFKKKNGELIPVTLKFVPVYDEEGNILHSYAVWRDISDLKKAQEEISKKNEIISARNKDFMDSVNYAKKIQQALLPKEEEIAAILPQSFTFLKPKDVVSGDFYWFHKKDEKVYFVAADSTGHGVPGALMSMIGTSLFNEVVIERGVTEPCKILNAVKYRVISSLHQDEGEGADGMDLALCVYEPKSKQLQFAGANNPLYIIRDKKEPLRNNKGEIIALEPKLENAENYLYEIKGNKQPVGYYLGKNMPFKSHTVQLIKGDVVYIFSDGFADQFGGPFGKKYMYRQFKQFLLSISTESIDTQYTLVERELSNWMGDEMHQTDDVCVIGMKV